MTNHRLQTLRLETLRLKIDPENLDSDNSRAVLDTAAAILRADGLVAFATETVYGLGANALRAEAVEKIFLAKQRPAWDPLIVHISDEEMLASVVDAEAHLTPSANALISAFWPGPLTLLLPKAEAIPPIVTAGRPLVGVRMPAHPVARALIAAAGVPIAAPSANRFGRISPTRAAHVLEDLDGRIDAVLDAGETAHGLESTVVDASQEPVILYRPGIITLQEIRRYSPAAIQWQPSPPLSNDGAAPESMPAPGVGIRHYAPRARLVLIAGSSEEQAAALLEAAETAVRNLTRTGIMLPENWLPANTVGLEGRALIFNWGDWRDPAVLAHRLFAGLRLLDAAGVELILCPIPPPEGLGTAIQDRLIKAAMTE